MHLFINVVFQGISNCRDEGGMEIEAEEPSTEVCMLLPSTYNHDYWNVVFLVYYLQIAYINLDSKGD